MEHPSSFKKPDLEMVSSPIDKECKNDSTFEIIIPE
jgi:hypothetical protein